MAVLTYSVVAVLGLIVLGLTIYRWRQSLRNKAAAGHNIDVSAVVRDDFHAVWTEADAFVRGADAWTMYFVGDSKAGIKPNPFFLPAIVTSSIILAFAVSGGFSLGGGQLFYGLLFAAVLAIVQIIQAVVSVSGDKGKANAWELDETDRSYGSWALLCVLLLVNIGAALVGSVTVGSDVNTQANIAAANLKSDISQREHLQSRLNGIQTRLSNAGQGMDAAALQTKANALKAEAIRESWRSRGRTVVDEAKVQSGEYGPKCGPKCSDLAKQAAAMQELAKLARSRPTIRQQLNSLNSKLADVRNVSTEGMAVGARLEEISGGVISKDDAAKNVFVLFQLLIVWLDWILWLRVGDVVGRARAAEYDRRAELANEFLSNTGIAPRYPRKAVFPVTAPDAPPAADAATNQQQIVISAEQDVGAIIAASPDLQKIDKAFASLLEAEDGRALTFGVFYRVYAEHQKAAGRKTWMAQAQFIQALKRYCELTGASHAGGKLLDVRLAADVEAEVADASDMVAIA